MNSRQESRYSMLRQVKAHLEKNTDITAQLPGFAMYFSKLETAMEQLQQQVLLQMQNLQGIGKMKQQARLAMMELAVDMARRVKAFAMLGGNLELGMQMNVSKRHLVLAADTEAAVIAGMVLEKAQGNAAALVPYGVGAAEFAALQQAIEAYMALLPAPRTAIANRKGSSVALALRLKEAMEALKFIDMLVEIVKDVNRDFYSAYHSARKLKNHSLRHLAMRGVVTDKATGAGIGGVKLELALDEASLQLHDEKEVRRLIKKKVLVVKKSYNKGGWWVKHLREGAWHLRASLVGYATHVETVYPVKGEMKVVKVEMERVGELMN